MTAEELEALINGLDSLGTIDGSTDLVPIIDTSTSSLKKTTRNTYLGLESAPLGTTDAQNPTNKTFDNSNVFTIRDDRLTLQDNSDTTKQVVLQLSGITTATTRTLTIPDASTTLVGTTNTQTLTNKTLTSPTINSPTIVNPTITVDAISEYTSGNGVSIDGMLIKDGHPGDGTVTPNSLAATAPDSWVWQDYVPTWTNLTIGTSTVRARYTQVGGTVHVRGSVTIAGGNFPSADLIMSLPTPSVASYSAGEVLEGSANFIDTGTRNYEGSITWGSTTTVRMRAKLITATYVSDAQLSASIPHAWANTDIISWAFSYEVSPT